MQLKLVTDQLSTPFEVDGEPMPLTVIYTIVDGCPSRFAAERTDTYIKVWFWDRNDPSVPGEIRNGAGQAHPDAWVSPLYSIWETLADLCTCTRVFLRRTSLTRLAKSPDFSPRIISLSTLRFVRSVNYTRLETTDKEIKGGDWAGAVYSQSGCPGSCIGEQQK